MRQTSTKVHFSTSSLRKEQEPCCRTEDASRRLSCLFLHVLGALLQWCSPRGSLAWDCLKAVFLHVSVLALPCHSGALTLLGLEPDTSASSLLSCPCLGLISSVENDKFNLKPLLESLGYL